VPIGSANRVISCVSSSGCPMASAAGNAAAVSVWFSEIGVVILIAVGLGRGRRQAFVLGFQLLHHSPRFSDDADVGDDERDADAAQDTPGFAGVAVVQPVAGKERQDNRTGQPGREVKK